jgi:hypothetical protein
MVEYYQQLGAYRRLNEIVFAGSHDAGITGGGGNEKTQNLDILGQARAGVRIFDLRIAGARAKVDGHRAVELKAYHGGPSKKEVVRRVVGMEGKKNVTRSVMKFGTWGVGLQQMLKGALAFVQEKTNEFLILKFDKCINWDLIAEMCVDELGDALYREAGNLNKKTLEQLRGKVIVLFTPGGQAAIDDQFRGTGGILGIKNLYGNGQVYDKTYNGLQYYGKGGTDLTTAGKGRSIQENYVKQLRLMQGGAVLNRNVMGMMYWTTTGVAGSIENRNKKMWEPKHRQELRDLWQAGMGTAVKARAPEGIDPDTIAGGAIFKRFLPNIIMIDFASPNKCRTIFRLNQLIPTDLVGLGQ